MPISAEARSAQKKAWYQENIDEQRSKNRARAANRRARHKELLQPFACTCCGDPDDTVIQWHHVEEQEKDFEILGGKGTGVSEELWWNEVLKCIPLCANCHVKLHKNKLCLIPPKLR